MISQFTSISHPCFLRRIYALTSRSAAAVDSSGAQILRLATEISGLFIDLKSQAQNQPRQRGLQGNDLRPASQDCSGRRRRKTNNVSNCMHPSSPPSRNVSATSSPSDIDDCPEHLAPCRIAFSSTLNSPSRFPSTFQCICVDKHRISEPRQPFPPLCLYVPIFTGEGNLHPGQLVGRFYSNP